jgi:hypothetical protein
MSPPLPIELLGNYLSRKARTGGEEWRGAPSNWRIVHIGHDATHVVATSILSPSDTCPIATQICKSVLLGWGTPD